MWNKLKSSAWFVALAFVFLFFGPAVSKTYAWDGRPRAEFRGTSGFPHARFNSFAGQRAFGRDRGFFPRRSFFGGPRFAGQRFGFARPFFRPFRLVRVRVWAPYPHWVFRRVYFSDPLGGYCSPY